LNGIRQKLPSFRSEDEEIEFWSSHDSTDYIDWEKARPAYFPDLKPSTRTISIRLPTSLLYRIKEEANRRDVPYQSLIKAILSEKIKEWKGS